MNDLTNTLQLKQKCSFFLLFSFSLSLDFWFWCLFICALWKFVEAHKKFNAFGKQNARSMTKNTFPFAWFLFPHFIAELKSFVHWEHSLRLFFRYIVFCISKQISIYFRYSIAKIFEKWFQHASNLCLTFGSCFQFFSTVIDRFVTKWKKNTHFVSIIQYRDFVLDLKNSLLLPKWRIVYNLLISNHQKTYCQWKQCLWCAASCIYLFCVVRVEIPFFGILLDCLLCFFSHLR